MTNDNKPDLKVITLRESNFRDVPNTLRSIADDIESGRFGEVREIALVTFGERVEVFSIGEGDATTAHVLFAVAMRKLEEPFESRWR